MERKYPKLFLGGEIKSNFYFLCFLIIFMTCNVAI